MFSSQNSQVSNDVNYIEDVFSTYLYTGNGSTQTITNNIDLAGKGGLTWIKNRGVNSNHTLYDTVRGVNKVLYSDVTSAQDTTTASLTSFNSNGFSVDATGGYVNSNTYPYVSWTFREQPKFFDVVTYTGNGTLNREVADVGYEIGMAFVKATSTTSDWFVGHRSLAVTGPNNGLKLNSSQAYTYGGLGPGLEDIWLNANRNGSLVVSSGGSTNTNGVTYVAYIFAHNAGGFGLTGNDNVISCGTFTTDGTGAAGNITLGYESQLVMFKRSDGVGNWQIVDTMRGSSLTSYNYISPTVSNAESSSTSAGQGIFPTATGFYVGNNFPGANQTYVYMAIRRGPMKVPTLGTSVFSPNVAAGGTVTTNFAVDAQIFYNKSSNDTIVNGTVVDRLRGVASTTTQQGNYLQTASTNAELNTYPYMSKSWSNTGFGIPDNTGGISSIYWSFRRAPGFFDEVCYTGTGSSNTISHNLTVTPELIISKQRSGVNNWLVSSPSLGKSAYLNTVDAFSASYVVYGSVTSASFTALYSGSIANGSGQTYVAYLFATCPGVSKVGTYTGTAAAQTINCGFTSGARFVLIKRFDAQPDTTSGPWYVWDSARGITSGNDPYLLLNSTGAEVTSLNYVDTDATGFKLTTDSGPQKALNDSGGTYIFLAIA